MHQSGYTSKVWLKQQRSVEFDTKQRATSRMQHEFVARPSGPSKVLCVHSLLEHTDVTIMYEHTVQVINCLGLAHPLDRGLATLTKPLVGKV